MTPQTSASRVAAESTTTFIASREAASFVITVSGDLDYVAVEGAALSSVLSSYRSNEPLDVVFDLEGVTFLDSAGLGWLMGVRAAATLASRRVRMRRSSTSVDSVLDMTQLKRYFPAESVPQ